jgi:hypothetical protein
MMLAFHCALAAALLSARVHGALGAPPGPRLLFSRRILGAALAAPLLVSLLPAWRWQGAPAQVWSGGGGGMARQAVLQIGAAAAAPVPIPDWAAWTWPALAALVALVLLRDLLALRGRLRGVVPLRSVGRVRVVSSSRAVTPWTAVLGPTAWVVLDPGTAADARLRRLVLHHELQHLRSGDARWAWVLAALRPAFLFSPVALWLRRWLVECEELACDEAVAKRRRIGSRRYAAALLDVAERGLGVAPSPLAALHAHSLLRRRIEMLLSPPPRPRPLADAFALACAALLIGTAAWAVDAAIDDHRIDLPRAEAMARRASSTPGFPVTANEVVLGQLNKLAATPAGRKRVESALKKRPQQLAVIRKALEAQGLPTQLEAVVLVESGYENLNADPNGAGIWQFVVPTARHYGLRVEPDVDQRMDPALESGAAVRYLADLRRQFGAWPLALAAYTQGEQRVVRVIETEGTRDAWELIRRRALDPYPATVMAAALLLADPSAAGF